jgi:hypothetical protein
MLEPATGSEFFGKLVLALMDKSPATRNRTRDHLIAAALYSQMLYQLSYRRGTCKQPWETMREKNIFSGSTRRDFGETPAAWVTTHRMIHQPL